MFICKEENLLMRSCGKAIAKFKRSSIVIIAITLAGERCIATKFGILLLLNYYLEEKKLQSSSSSLTAYSVWILIT